MTRNEEMREACRAFHKSHPEVWSLFCRFAMEKASRGFRHFGAKAVMERIRWETAGGATSPELKISNNHTAFYARRFNRLHPHISNGNFFRCHDQASHRTASHRTAATGQPAFQQRRVE